MNDEEEAVMGRKWVASARKKNRCAVRFNIVEVLKANWPKEGQQCVKVEVM